jgi:hypothetical protein
MLPTVESNDKHETMTMQRPRFSVTFWGLHVIAAGIAVAGIYVSYNAKEIGESEFCWYSICIVWI